MKREKLRGRTIGAILAILLAATMFAASGCTDKKDGNSGSISWGSDITKAIEQAKSSRKQVLIDFWGSG